MSFDYISEKPAHYKNVYGEELPRHLDRPLLELGVQRGGSLIQWSDWYPDAQIVGVDIDWACGLGMFPDNVAIRIGDVTSQKFLTSLIEEFAPFSVVIDDCGHWPFMQRIALKALWPHLTIPGTYVIEDLHTGFNPRYGGGWPWYGFLNDLNKLTRKIHQGPSDIAYIKHYQCLVFLGKGVPYNAEAVKTGTQDCRHGKGIDGSTALAMVRARLKLKK